MSSEEKTTGTSRIEASWVARSFDSLAEEYDQQCRDKAYPGPAVVHEVLTESLGNIGSSVSILDLGCGTGLLGPVLRPLASELVGVDLSEQMLNKARATSAYDLLEHADALDYLGRHHSEFDIIVAAGVFHYFGELSPLLRHCFEALRPNGLLLFTLANGPLMGDSHYYQPEQYFTHAPQYVMQQLGELGINGGSLRRVLWPAADQHSEHALVVAVRRPKLEC